MRPYLLGETLTNRDNGARWPGRSWRRTGPTSSSGSRPTACPGWWAASARCATAASPSEVVAFLDDHPIPQGDQQVRQHIERMWVTVALAERESPRLAASLTYLSGH